jgi:hypothetical protein
MDVGGRIEKRKKMRQWRLAGLAELHFAAPVEAQ